MTESPFALRMYALLLAVLLGALSLESEAQTTTKKRSRTKKSLSQLATEYCRDLALTHLKYAKTVEWTDRAREETAGVLTQTPETATPIR
jgi:hypothetical protein